MLLCTFLKLRFFFFYAITIIVWDDNYKITNSFIKWFSWPILFTLLQKPLIIIIIIIIISHKW